MTDDDCIDLEERGRDATIAKAASVNHRAFRAMTPPVREAMKRRVRTHVERNLHAREHLRWLINGGECIDRLQAIAATLREGVEELPEPMLDTETGLVVRHRTMGKDRVAALKAEADIHFKLLGKVVPDLKAVEFRTDDAPSDGQMRSMSVRELALKLFHAAVESGVTLEAEEVEPELVQAEGVVPPWLR